MGSLPYEPHSRDDTKGAKPPLESPAEMKPILNSFGYTRGCILKNHVSSRAKRNMSLFNRAAAEVSSIDPPQIR